jgi:hypothetical protein
MWYSVWSRVNNIFDWSKTISPPSTLLNPTCAWRIEIHKDEIHWLTLMCWECDQVKRQISMIIGSRFCLTSDIVTIMVAITIWVQSIEARISHNFFSANSWSTYQLLTFQVQSIEARILQLSQIYSHRLDKGISSAEVSAIDRKESQPYFIPLHNKDDFLDVSLLSWSLEFVRSHLDWISDWLASTSTLLDSKRNCIDCWGIPKDQRLPFINCWTFLTWIRPGKKHRERTFSYWHFVT